MRWTRSGRSSTRSSRSGGGTSPCSRTTRPAAGDRSQPTTCSNATAAPGAGTDVPSASAQVDEWQGDDVTIAEIQEHLADLRLSAVDGHSGLSTSVMTHTAWVPKP